MRLTLTVRSYCDQPPADPQSRCFDSFPVIVGRSNSSDYCLNDVSRYISSNHALITLDNKQLLLQDTSANGVYINGAPEPVGRGRNVALKSGDAIAIGDYTLSITIDNQNSPEHDSPTDNLFADFGNGSSTVPSAPSAYDPFRGDEPDWTPPSQSSDPFGDNWETDDQPSRSESESQNSPNEGAEDWANWSNEAAPAQPQSHVLTDQIPAPPADKDFDWLPGASSETISNPPPLQDSALSQQSSPSVQQPSPGSNSAQDYASIHPANTQAEKSTPKQAEASSREPNRHPSASNKFPEIGTQSAQPIKTLLSAATLREADFARYSEAQVLEKTGKLLALTVDAMMALLQSRAEVKNAIKSDVTTLSRSGNNPLKFSFSAGDALTKLLSDDVEGYMSADKAIQEAVDDLKLHQLAMLDGMKAAVESMLSEFDPGKLAKNLKTTGGLSANIPITREAKLWELFCEQYDAIREEAVNDFSELFGAEFKKAYEQRIRQLGREPDF